MEICESEDKWVGSPSLDSGNNLWYETHDDDLSKFYGTFPLVTMAFDGATIRWEPVNYMY